MNFQGQNYRLNQVEELWQFIHESKPGEYTLWYDTIVFHTERNGFVAAYADNLDNYWNI